MIPSIVGTHQRGVGFGARLARVLPELAELLVLLVLLVLPVLAELPAALSPLVPPGGV